MTLMLGRGCFPGREVAMGRENACICGWHPICSLWLPSSHHCVCTSSLNTYPINSKIHFSCFIFKFSRLPANDILKNRDESISVAFYSYKLREGGGNALRRTT